MNVFGGVLITNELETDLPGRDPADAQVKGLPLWTGHLGAGSVMRTGGSLRTASHDASSLAAPIVGAQTAATITRCL